MLADVGDHDGLAAGLAPQVGDDVGGVEMTVVGKILDVADGDLALEFGDVGEPRGSVDGSLAVRNIPTFADPGNVGRYRGKSTWADPPGLV